MDNCSIRYLTKANNDNQIANFSNWWREQLQIYGTEVNYYTRTYTLSGEDPVYGEDFQDSFENPKHLIVGANITNDSSMLSRFGIVIDSDATVYMHINDFKAVFGMGAEPKSGDVIELIEIGTDRPGVRGSPKYVVTNREDDDLPIGMNPLMAHFLWFLKLKRFEFSHEDNITPERGTGIIDDQGQLPSDITDDSDPDSRFDRSGVPGEVTKHPGTSGTYPKKEDEVYGNY